VVVKTAGHKDKAAKASKVAVKTVGHKDKAVKARATKVAAKAKTTTITKVAISANA
jgi:hypothetical protein